MRWNYKDIVRWAVSRALVRTGEQRILAPQCHRPHRSFNDIGVERGAAILEEHCQTAPVRQRVTERLGDRGATGDAVELCGHPGMHRLDQGAALLLADPKTFFRRLATQIDLDRVKARDPAQRLFRERRLRGGLNVEELPPRMGPTQRVRHVGVGSDEANKPGVAVGLQQAAEALQMLCRMRALAIFAEDVGHRRMAGSVPVAIVDRVAPQPSGFGTASARVQHRQSGVVGEHDRRGQHRAQHQFVQWGEPPAGATDPRAQGGTIQCHALPGEDLDLAIQRRVIAIFADHDVRHQCLCGHAAVDWTVRRGGLNHGALTRATAKARTADQLHAQLRRHVIEHLRAVLTDHVQRTTTARAGGLVRLDYHLDPRQMRGQRAPVSPRRSGFGRGSWRVGLRRRQRGVQSRLMLRQGLFEIVDALFRLLVIKPFGTATEAISLHARYQQTQPLDLRGRRAQDQL